MRPALHGRDQVDVAFGQQFAAFRQPQQRPVHGFRLAGEGADERFFRQQRQAVYGFAQVVVKAIGIAPALLAVVDLIAKHDFHAGTQHRFRF